jgi:23S rRNA (adenine2503-C2)-methyltransferase
MPPQNVRLLDLSYTRLSELLQSLGHKSYTAKQVWLSVHRQKVLTYNNLTNLSLKDRHSLSTAIPLRAPQILTQQCSVDGTRKFLVDVPSFSTCGESKPNPAAVEMVYIPERDVAHSHKRRRPMSHNERLPETPTSPSHLGDRSRATLCVSSQVGCSLSCSFCHTGTQRFQHNLSAGDIVGQVLVAMKETETIRTQHQNQQTHSGVQARGNLAQNGDVTVSLTNLPPEISNIVFMGQGRLMKCFVAE